MPLFIPLWSFSQRECKRQHWRCFQPNQISEVRDRLNMTNMTNKGLWRGFQSNQTFQEQHAFLEDDSALRRQRWNGRTYKHHGPWNGYNQSILSRKRPEPKSQQIWGLTEEAHHFRRLWKSANPKCGEIRTFSTEVSWQDVLLFLWDNTTGTWLRFHPVVTPTLVLKIITTLSWTRINFWKKTNLRTASIIQMKSSKTIRAATTLSRRRS